MTESQFIKENKAKWKELEEALHNNSNDPDQLHVLFKKVSGDLSFAQTYFPRRSVRWYLNSLVNGVFDTMRIKKKLSVWTSLKLFYNETLPREIVKNKNAFIASFVIFILSFSVGVFSTLEDNDFPKSILGSMYMSITEQNIEKGDPMGIYKNGSELEAFLGITLNNIRVAFLTFVLGFLASIGSFFILIKNGVMVGVFQTIFYKKGLFFTSFLTIWIHGTLEISSIIIAGAAGIIVGNSILFPGTYSRMESLLVGSLKGIYIMLSTIPLFLIAGFFEGFVTRITDMSPIIKIMIIVASLFFIIFTYAINPYLYYKSGRYMNYIAPTIPFGKKSIELQDEKTVQSTFNDYRSFIDKIIFTLLLPLGIAIALPLYFIAGNLIATKQSYGGFLSINVYDFEHGNWPMSLILILASIYFFSFMNLIKNVKDFGIIEVVVNVSKHFLGFSVASILLTIPLYFLSGYYVFLSLLVIPFSISIIINDNLEPGEADTSAIGYAFKIGYKFWIDILGINIGIIALVALGYFSIDEISSSFLEDILSWHNLFDNKLLEQTFMVNYLRFIFLLLVMPFAYFLFTNKISTIFKNKYSTDLIEKIENFGLSNRYQN